MASSASRISDEVFDVKSKMIEDLEEKFHNRLRQFTSDVKKTMRVAPPQVAMEVFTFAIAFLTQALQNIPDLEGSSLSRREDMTATMLNTDIQTSMAATTASTASNQGPISAAASPPKPIQGLSQRSSFSVKCSNDRETPGIFDLKLLPCGLMVLADFWNRCLKIFNTQGQHINTLTLNGEPQGLAVLDLTSSCGWDVAVTLFGKCQVALVHVTTSCAELKETIQTSREYNAIAAVSTDTLAVGCWEEDGIDIIDLCGQVIRTFNSGVNPNYMYGSLDGHLLVSSYNSEIVKIKLLSGSVEYRHKLKELKRPRGITCPQEYSSLIAADLNTRTLHLINPEGGWVRRVWSHPGGEDREDGLLSVSLLRDICVCSTYRGTVFVLDVKF